MPQTLFPTQLPKMVLFDYGQTLLYQKDYDLLRGEYAILQHVTENPHGYTAEDVLAFSAELHQDMHAPANRSLLEMHNLVFQRHLYEALELRFDCSLQELEAVFWDSAGPATHIPGTAELLAYLAAQNIPTGVISNLSFSGSALEKRLSAAFPQHPFSFVLASSEYGFRKPSPRLFALALVKAKLPAEQIWFAGDNPVADVEGAAACGMLPIWFCGAAQCPGAKPAKEAEPACPHWRVEHWQQVEDMLEALCTKGG